MSINLKTEPRDESTKSALNELRSKGKIPGIVYGKKIKSTLIAIEEKELLQLLGSNPRAVVEMDVPKAGKYPVMINQIQRDKLSRNVLHIDFEGVEIKADPDDVVVTFNVDRLPTQ